MACSHLLSKNGICPCGWRKPEPPPDPALVEAWWDAFVAAWHEVSIAHAKITERARAAQCRRRFSQFVRDAWPTLRPGVPLVWTWYMEALCDHIQWILEGWRRSRKQRGYIHPVRTAAFSVPPGSAKTLLLSVCAPAWMWIDSPEWSVICLSVNPGVARDAAVDSRNLISSDWYRTSFVEGIGVGESAAATIDPTALDDNGETFEQWAMSKDRDTQGKFVNTRGGFRASQGLSAQIVGQRGDALIIDDPDDPQASGEAFFKTSEKFDRTLWNRVNDLSVAVRLLIQQRLDVDDLTGHVTRTYGADVMHMVLPLLYEPDRACRTRMPVNARNQLWLEADKLPKDGTWADPRRIPGECLSTIRFSDKEVARLKLSHDFNSIYQQDPDRADGEHFKIGSWEYFRRADEDALDVRTRYVGSSQKPALVIPCERKERGGGMQIQSLWVTMDPTMGSTSDAASEVGLLVVAQYKDKFLVLHDEAPGSLGILDQLLALDHAIMHAVQLTGHLHVKLLVEKKALGESIYQMISKHVADAGYTMGERHIAVSVETCDPGREDKDSRGYAMEPTQAVGDVLLLDGAPWIPAFLREFKRFPKKPNDRVDALGQLIAKLQPKPGTKYGGWAAASARMGSGFFGVSPGVRLCPTHGRRAGEA